MRRSCTGEEGSTLPLTIFYGFLVLVLILLVAAASSLYLERKRLFSLADAASLVGSEAFPLDDVQQTATGEKPVLTNAEVDAAVREYLTERGDTGFESLTLERAATDDGVSATVVLSAYWRPPMLTLLMPRGLRIEVTTRARSVFS